MKEGFQFLSFSPLFMAHFTLSVRKMLAELLQQKTSYREIKKIIGLSISSISDEIKRNSENGRYDPYIAHKKALQRQEEKTKRTKIEISDGLKRFVVSKMKEDWSPEQIAGELKQQANGKTVISHETIYQFIYSKDGKQEKLWKHLRHRKKPERIPWGTRKKRNTGIPSRKPISERPRFVELRDEIGHYEGDLMQFSSCGKTLAVFVERMSRKVCIIVNEDKSASEMEMAIHEMICQFGQRNMKTLTLDNGKENVCHQKVREDYMESFDTFFCDSYCSWQKGAVENMNKLIRQYFPRDLPPENITQDYADLVAEKLNSRPRKCLNYETPSFVFQKCSV